MPDLSRRGFLIGAGAVVAAAALPVKAVAETLWVDEDIWFVLHPSQYADIQLYGADFFHAAFRESECVPCPLSFPSKAPTLKLWATSPARKPSRSNSNLVRSTSMKAYRRTNMRG